ncbi:hypothetical protein V6N13_115613 [Hibiscus sabdariffa]|uniref:Uncharacterized protein n=1 Tax=Hibiscus sabdariffa TaxID=183260 RepID=A0ABR2CSB2_9ROSI
MAVYPNATDQPPQGLAPPDVGAVTVPSQEFHMQNYYMHPTGNVLWSTGVCDCCYDVPNCMITMLCPCVTFGQIAEIVDHGSVSSIANGLFYTVILWSTGLACIYSSFYRSRMRKQYMLAETPYPDWCLHVFCESCALCQEYRELKNRGFNMFIGWDANMEKLHQQAKQMSVPPVVEDGMNR